MINRKPYTARALTPAAERTRSRRQCAGARRTKRHPIKATKPEDNPRA